MQHVIEKLHKFHAIHFEDPARNAWFSEQIAQYRTPAVPMHFDPTPVPLEDREDAWTSLQDGEDDAAWQARHGVHYLTPGAARIFDRSRRFREQRTLTY